jgi:hypothetical protein
MVMPAWVTTTARVARRVPAEAGGPFLGASNDTRPLAWAERHAGGAVPRRSLGSRSSSGSSGSSGSRVPGFLGVPRSSSEFLGVPRVPRSSSEFLRFLRFLGFLGFLGFPGSSEFLGVPQFLRSSALSFSVVPRSSQDRAVASLLGSAQRGCYERMRAGSAPEALLPVARGCALARYPWKSSEGDRAPAGAPASGSQRSVKCPSGARFLVGCSPGVGADAPTPGYRQ